jgi:cytochrome c556
MTRKFTLALVAATLGSLAAPIVIGQPNPNQLINNRKGAMNLQAKYFGPVLAMSLGRAPYDAKIVQRNVEYLTALADMPWDDFQPHTQGHQNTRAKDDVWKDPAKFKQGIERFQGELKKLQAVARGGADQNAVRPAAQAVGRACNSCHEAFATFDFRFRVE